MSATTYYGTTAEEQLAVAERVLVEHATGIDGRCGRCRTLGPCYRRETALSVFSRTLRLPRRAPGASRPELLGAKTAGTAKTVNGGSFRWLG